jgi:hypothetical protein
MFINHGLILFKLKFISYWLDNPSLMGSKLRYNKISLRAKTDSTRFNCLKQIIQKNHLAVNKIEEIPHNRHSSRFNPQCIRHRRLQLNKHTSPSPSPTPGSTSTTTQPLPQLQIQPNPTDSPATPT